MSNLELTVLVYGVAIAISFISAIVTIWIGIDQIKYKEANGFMWVILNALLPPVGWIGYLINRHMVKKDAKKYTVEATNVL